MDEARDEHKESDQLFNSLLEALGAAEAEYHQADYVRAYGTLVKVIGLSHELRRAMRDEGRLVFDAEEILISKYANEIDLPADSLGKSMVQVLISLAREEPVLIEQVSPMVLNELNHRGLTKTIGGGLFLTEKGEDLVYRRET